MKTVKHLLTALLLTPTLLFAQNNEEMIHMDQEHQSQVFFEQNLNDFSTKIHSVIIESYTGFKTTDIDFYKGVNETITESNSKKSFNVTYTSNNDELIAIALQKEIVNRIMTVSPKGFIQSKSSVDATEITTISFDPQYADKATFQPTMVVILDYDTLTVKVVVTEPLQK